MPQQQYRTFTLAPRVIQERTECVIGKHMQTEFLEYHPPTYRVKDY